MKKFNFTLIELLIVVAIIGILLSILMPSLSKSHEKARRAVCMNNQRQMYLSVAIWSKNNNEKLPSAEPDNGSAGYRFLGQPGTEAYEAIKENVSIDVFSCPSWDKHDPVYYDPGKRWVWQRGSLYLGNLDTSNFTTPRYVTPKSFSAENTKALFACRTLRSDFHGITTFAHGARGAMKVNAAAEPSKSGCEGTNVARLDGSSAFERSLQRYAALPSGVASLYFTEE